MIKQGNVCMHLAPLESAYQTSLIHNIYVQVLTSYILILSDQSV